MQADQKPTPPQSPQLPQPSEPPDPTTPDQHTPGQAAPSQTAPAPPGLPQHKIRRTRASGIWVATGCFAVVLLLLLIFILQNSQTVSVSYLGAHGHLSLGVALLLAAVCGVLLVVLAGTARILQLRSTARRHRRADKKSAAAASRPPV
jgi:uncharacterized integral membrane protein